MNATVIKTTGKYYVVKTESGSTLECRLKGKFRIAGIKSTNPIVVGDHVEIVQEGDQWMITQLLKRKNYILRRSVNLSKHTHIIAANVDQAILMITLNSPITTTAFIDRFLVAANAYAVDVVLLFNKTDLLDEKEKLELDSLQHYYQRIGYLSCALSVINDDLFDVQEILKGKVNMMVGHSGVGKSTLINRLQPNLNIITQPVSETHQQGQHTTTFSELHELDFGGSIMDTPGIKGFGLVSLEEEKIGNYFKEFFDLKTHCKFHNCMHKDEPDCAVKLALEKRLVSESRYKNYLDMLVEKDDLFRKNDY